MKDINIRIGGQAGFGISVAANLIAKTCKDAGLQSFTSFVYPSLIRGGHNTADIRISPNPIFSNCYSVDILLALNTDTIVKHTQSLNKDSIVVYDSSETELADGKKPDINYIDIPINEIAVKNGGKIMKNTVIVAACLSLLKINNKYFKEKIKQIFSKKGNDIINNNILCVDETSEFIEKNYTKKHDFQNFKHTNLSNHLMLNGNQAIALGALKSGCKFISAYPMTPATSIMETLAKYEKEMNIVVKHVEDELSAINMALGASFAGTRSMTATSGGGFTLMIEGLGSAIAQEMPIVVVIATRTGPGSGMPTHTGQGDLNLALYSGTDDGPRIVLAPGDVEECFYLTFEAFNLAEEYQMPVIILTDKHLATSINTTPYLNLNNLKVKRGKLLKQGDLDKDYKRYKIIENDPISPRTTPGIKNGMHVASSYVHDEYGHECDEPINKEKMHEKLYDKLKLAKKRLPLPKIRGSTNAEISIISWGSTKQYLDQIISESEIKIRHLHLSILSPFPTETVTKFIDSSKKIILIEQNYEGQLYNLIKQKCLRTVNELFLKYDGHSLDIEKIKEKIKSM